MFEPDGRPIPPRRPLRLTHHLQRTPAKTPRGEGALLLPASAARRNSNLGRTLGSATGRVNGKARHLRMSEDGTAVEYLVDERSGLLTEINAAKSGRLVSRTTYSYSSLPDGRMFVSRKRTENTLPLRPGHRVVTQSSYSNVRVVKEAQ